MSKRKPTYNRRQEDVGNILAMEHVNVTVPDQQLATQFYVNGLGLTRDPYMDFGSFNVWVNAGRQQFHLPTASAQVLRGKVGLVVPDIDSLEQRLERLSSRLANTRFSFKRSSRHLDVTCPWGNHIRCLPPQPDMQLGISWVELDVPADTTAGIARFYEEIMGCSVTVKKSACQVAIGQHQQLRFKETRKKLLDYDGHHIAIYVSNFSGPHQALLSRNLITEESDQHQYRFQTIIDPATGDALFELEHEVRSLHHPMFARPLINRNAEQRFLSYQKDRDAFVPS